MKLVGSVILKDVWNEELRFFLFFIYNIIVVNIIFEVYFLVDRYLKVF